jgi:acyl-CoA thioesterase-1
MIFLNKNVILLLTLLLALSPASRAQFTPGEESVLPDSRILIVGDSLSAAYNMETSQAWPSLLQSRLKQDGYPFRVFNSSISGDTTQGGLARLPRLLERHRPAIVILELGGNDGLRGLPSDVTRQNIAKMTTLSQQAGAKVLLTGIRIPPNYGADYVGRFESIYPDVASEYGAALVPFFMENVVMDAKLMQADGVHPSIAGQPVLLDTLWPKLEPLLTPASAGTPNE